MLCLDMDQSLNKWWLSREIVPETQTEKTSFGSHAFGSEHLGRMSKIYFWRLLAGVASTTRRKARDEILLILVKLENQGFPGEKS